MSLADLPVLDMLRTQGFQAQDLERVDFSNLLASSPPRSLGTARTDAMHIGQAAYSTDPERFDTGDANDFETTPSGNAVVLEEQMMKVTSNQMDYQAVTTLYSKSINLLRIALGQGNS